MDTGVCVLELLGVLFCIGAWLSSLATTIMSNWLTLSTDLLPTESYRLGLWQTCVVQDLGGMECRPYDSLLDLPPDIRLARILMCVTLVTGLLALLLSLPGIYLINSCDSRPQGQHIKSTLKLLGGVLCILAGVLGLIPVSYIAHLTILRFFDDSVPAVVPRWEFGDALFCGWTAALLHLVAGVLLVASCMSHHEEASTLGVPLQRMRGRPISQAGQRKIPEYV